MKPLLIFLPLAAFLAALVTIKFGLATRLAGRLALDVPNARSLHTRPTPRTGGLMAMPWAIAAGAMVGDPTPIPWLAAGLLLVSILDDRYDLPILFRFGAHVGAAAVAAAAYIDNGLVLCALVAVAIAWMINLFNFMDGSDGLAGGMAVFGFSGYALAAAQAGQPALAAASACIAAGALAFLCFNFPPASVFLGDAGSVPLGFLAAALGLQGWHQQCWPAWFPILVFSPFILDASLTLSRRILRGERFWQAHREHGYQRLIRSGWSHRQLLGLAYPLMAAAAGSALLLRQCAAETVAVGLLVWLGIYAGVAMFVERRWRRLAEARA